ncbi:hypothetical protein FO059_13785 [Tomitella fengzijianii]|uniref:Integral membrane protein n=1 Tax=Tomitella fengzijianii TaxID=2597660 RepID=A0A516X8H6_9ACTN|nr:hypothetical protein FO059_13785 [Tomitella fengzijianii]
MPPNTVRLAGGIVTGEGVVGVGIAIFYVISALVGNHDKGISYYGTAAWFGVLFGGVLAAGVTLLMGKRGGRGVAIITQVLLAPFAFSLLGQSHQLAWGILIVLAIVPAFVLLVHPRTSEWMNRPYAHRADPDAGRSDDSDDPDD